MKVRVKKMHPDAVIPQYAKEGDNGLDLTAISYKIDEFGNHVYGTGLAFEIPEGYTGLLFPRSSNAKKDIILTNSVGVIDSNYRGEVSFKYREYYDRKIHGIKENLVYSVGDRIGQLIIIAAPYIALSETNELSETNRGSGAYGSTGK